MSKYMTSVEYLKINKLYKSIPKQLARDNNKFNYKLVDEKENYFKIYLSDVALLSQLSGSTKKDIYSDEMKLFRVC